MQEVFKPNSFHLVSNSGLWLTRVAAAATILWLFCGSTVLAVDSKKPAQIDGKNPDIEDEFPPTALDVTAPDPLLPRSDIDRPLNPTELQDLAVALDELDTQANAKLQVGDKEGAFVIWNRELQLRRLLGPLAEVNALGRVGTFAWSTANRDELRAIAQRLQTIQQQAQFIPSVDLTLSEALAQAYQQVRTPEQALSVYNQILSLARAREDSTAVDATLKTIAELYISKFDYTNAAATYKELLGSARAKSDHNSELIYLQQLAYLYQQLRQYEEAISLKEQLAELYLNETGVSQVPELRLEIASDYESLGKIEEAFRNYQEAYSSAWSLQQYARASNALQKLINLYKSRNQLDETLATSKILLESEQLAGDSYGMMNTYDQIAQIYLGRSNYTEALSAYQMGLELAQQLNIQETYFTNQISQVQQQIAKQTRK